MKKYVIATIITLIVTWNTFAANCSSCGGHGYTTTTKATPRDSFFNKTNPEWALARRSYVSGYRTRGEIVEHYTSRGWELVPKTIKRTLSAEEQGYRGDGRGNILVPTKTPCTECSGQGMVVPTPDGQVPTETTKPSGPTITILGPFDSVDDATFAKMMDTMDHPGSRYKGMMKDGKYFYKVLRR